jgi:PAS domain S-box-containing protein
MLVARLYETELRLKELTGGGVDGVIHPNGQLYMLQDAQEKLRLSESRFRGMFEAAAAGIAISTPHGRYLQVNAAYCQMLGYTEEELLTRDWASITHPEDLHVNLEKRDAVLAGQRNSFVMEKRYLRKNGDTQWTRISISAVRASDGEIKNLIVMAEDIGEQKLAELRLRRLNRLHTVLSKVSEAIVRTRERQELYEAVCHIVVEYGLLRMAYIAVVDTEARIARPVASHGAGLDDLLKTTSLIPLDGGPLGQGTVGTALRTGAPDACNDIRVAPRMQPWREAALKNGLLANASFPLTLHGAPIGVLVLYAGETDYFLDDEISLMATLAADVSFALELLEKERQRYRAENRMRQSEERFRTMLQGLEAGVVVHGGDSRITAFNETAEKLLGLIRGELFGLKAFDDRWSLVRRDGVPMTEAELPYYRVVASRQPVRNVVIGVMRPAEGDFVWLLVNANPTLTLHGDLAEVIVTFMDVTAQIHAEQALEESEGRYRALVEWSPESISVQREGKLLFVNPAAIRMMGARSADDLVGKSILDLVHPDFRQIVSERIRRGAAGESDLGMIEQKLIRLDGATIDVEIRGAPIMYGGKPALYGSMRDITKQKRMESRFRRLSDSNAQAIFFWNTKGEIIGANDAFLRLVGHSSEDLAAGRMNWMAMTPPDYADADRHALREAADYGTCTTYEKEFIRKDGSLTPILVGAAMFEDDPTEGVSFVVDLSERKRLEQQLRQSQKMESLGQLTGGIAHDFNNLLGIVQLNLELIREIGSDNAEVDEMAGMALEATERGASLTHRLLAFARQQPLEPKAVNITTLLSGMTNLLKRTLGEDIAIKTIVPPGLWIMTIDPHQLESALLNLAVNALHAMPDGGKLIMEASNRVLDETYLELNPEILPGDYIRVSVTDSGSGMSADILERVLEPFFTTKPVGKGSGLGLSMVHGFVKQSGGHLKIYSEPDHGTTVSLYLPRSVDAEQPMAVQQSEVTGSIGREVVLVVEDDPHLRSLTLRILTSLGYRTIEAENGPAACKELDSADRIDLLLTDIVLPNGMNGLELAKQTRSRRPGLKVLFMSGYPRDAASRNGVLDSDMHLLSKPFAKAELGRLVRHVLDERNSEVAPRNWTGG